MPVEAVAPTSGATATEAVRAPKQVMDSELFLTLLVTQLRNQDPSSPMDTNEMIGQTTQLATMEQLTNMANMSEENFSLQMRMAAAGLIGQTVTYTNAAGEAVTGTAGSVSYLQGVPTVNVDGVDVLLDAVSGVVAAGTAAPAPGGSAGSGTPGTTA
ncbi:flagellar hook assembly protein FlgD [Arthrobacter caoxuetaonis]|uniref:Flagellar hook capping protein n=1 Tax=Arthrobacter caoxuetaonis TaxID=2886935 RepID=A0A9X1SCL3_9MICC|nr:flagellar hook capping FlgD N-terminal domain-containing protein [Arthrobacter caoxuetaonis]MCC3283155.1 flagellar hook capping protein [Arthrobacter caoxuetaonis]MCC3298273.1 flagellar hook capping protein [Arthrobacter caoxuetaonis]USQ57709.1 flagellar hook capping protein [Arthrobacter caoxuetaonis]